MADLAVHHSLALPEDGAHGALAALSDKVPLKVYCAGEDVAARAAADQNLLTSLARLLHHSHLRIRGTDRHNPTGVQQAGKFEMQPRQRERQCRRQAGPTLAPETAAKWAAVRPAAPAPTTTISDWAPSALARQQSCRPRFTKRCRLAGGRSALPVKHCDMAVMLDVTDRAMHGGQQLWGRQHARLAGAGAVLACPPVVLLVICCLCSAGLHMRQLKSLHL